MDITARLIEDLEWCKSYLAENKKRLTERYKFCANRLEEMGLQIRKSTAGFFLWICGNASFEQETDFFTYLMENAKVFIVPGKESFCEQPGWFRITFTSNSNYVNKGLERIEKAIRSYKRKDSVTADNSNSMHISHILF
ncbi:1-aminocyclopropane-1-carboxylate synthase-like protein 1 [Trichonephila inaurata madagascariensis]|uniref:1-aminocyclopropane-1-carboxylate synthase-like protein 1 n=1 Tax=Trichonephila inaurata madagascariensis TaxID=2747483 RepID=A0A8X6XE20_9ARAC|nr:1-aminocyclopropane-1-carboxylate synthase-like protein 1 [Trichonephila inaurata madagascariensis]